jgi:hypothetical protein
MSGNALISGNTATATNGSGGGLYIWSGATFNMAGGTITNNKANSGGGVFLYAAGTFTGSPQIGGTTAPASGGWIHSNTKLDGTTPDEVYPAP